MPPAPVAGLVGRGVLGVPGVDGALVAILGACVGSALALEDGAELAVVPGELVDAIVVGATVGAVDGAVREGSPEALRAGMSVPVSPSSPLQEVKQIEPTQTNNAVSQVGGVLRSVVFMC
jgi:hypothetical protein